ncbi:hypothetical protein PsAD13_04867 [Pseudovibrio sp. Ad13]|uniref:MNIO family bufferin maturase n=1 Tax=unclassified Pseudovibrio TaxID=2627060 RepID=UPI0007AE5CFB|nr:MULTISPECIES: DUF692 domain-containing protein [unclassified Pseudovibrio]KZK76557.1 hypothetical protein PsAD46_05316 [Pseudovibrio sp. Ad46]KZK79877.1 hypothetical protein PsAD13_04867 [Pseudovibrio sp. Ad13]KZK97039.1 hypothetical protein PsAD26_05440 [Pseudovibrio sp. Ad26]KZL01423.1 hypothetical protein PsAD5_00658 [Pseudovibrio sp. Ad5]KZL04118.1 hypothetical protein PsW74_00155 [Pseudovibrio sp. W74]
MCAQRVNAKLPARGGVGLKADHYHRILNDKPDMGFFEIHAENYMGAGGPPHGYLEAIRRDYPISLHGVGLSIGGADPLNKEHLSRVKDVADRYDPGLFSEHLAWSTHDTEYFNDLLPLPYTEVTLQQVVDHIDEVQTFLGRQMLLENPSAYVIFKESTYEETEFLREIVKRTGCGLLLDVNNVFVSATNSGGSPEDYVDRFPVEHVQEIHLGGHAPETDELGYPLLIDAHDRKVADPVWALYARTIDRTGPQPTLIEWDANIPTWEILAYEAEQADVVIQSHIETQAQAAEKRGDHVPSA